MNPITDPSMRRFAVVIAGTLATTLNKRLGLELSPDTIAELLLFLGAYIVAGNAKAAVEAKAAAAGQAAAATVATPADAAAVLGGKAS